MAKRLRSGYTTGACAAAAAKAATLALCAGEIRARVEIPFPDQSRVVFELCRCLVDEAGVALASVVKDAGDDPDVTNGAEIVAQAQKTSSSWLGRGLVLSASRGWRLRWASPPSTRCRGK